MDLNKMLKDGGYSRFCDHDITDQMLAAQRVNVAQPSLSQHIIGVEKDLGVTLFNRSPRGMTLTQSGEILLAQVSLHSHVLHR